MALQEAQQYFERALELDPDSVAARVGAACVLGERLATGRTGSRSDDMVCCDRLLNGALERDRHNTEARAELGRLRRLQGRLTESQIELERALAADRNHARALIQLGITLIFLGQPAAALPILEKRLRTSPNWQNTYFLYYWLGHAHLLLGHADQAAVFLRRGLSANPDAIGVKVMLTAALALQGEQTEAQAIIREVVERKPEFSSLAGFNARHGNWNASPAYAALRQQTVDVGLRRAGLPEE